MLHYFYFNINFLLYSQYFVSLIQRLQQKHLVRLKSIFLFKLKFLLFFITFNFYFFQHCLGMLIKITAPSTQGLSQRGLSTSGWKMGVRMNPLLDGGCIRTEVLGGAIGVTVTKKLLIFSTSNFFVNVTTYSVFVHSFCKYIPV